MAIHWTRQPAFPQRAEEDAPVAGGGAAPAPGDQPRLVFEPPVAHLGPCGDEGRLLFVMAISGGSSVAVLPAPECDTDLVADEMTLLVEAVGDILTSATPRLARIANRDGRSRPC